MATRNCGISSPRTVSSRARDAPPHHHDERRSRNSTSYRKKTAAISTLMSISASLVRRVTEGAMGAAPTRTPKGETVVEIRKLMDVEDFGADFTPNEEIAKVKS